MISLKTLRDWFVIICLLIVLPDENRLALHLRPSDRYCELSGAAATRTVVVAKNSGAQSVAMELPSAAEVTVLQSDQQRRLLVKSTTVEAPPSSIVIAELAGGLPLGSERIVTMNGRRFAPGPLSVLTRGDVHAAYLIVIALFALFMMLGFVISRYGVESNFELLDKS